jgi:ferric-dicitrate binding protein FerR (iron transport regulator)
MKLHVKATVPEKLTSGTYKDKAAAATIKANEATTKADKENSFEDHVKAAHLHRIAATLYEKIGKDSEMSHHTKMAIQHDKKAKQARLKETSKKAAKPKAPQYIRVDMLQG